MFKLKVTCIPSVLAPGQLQCRCEDGVAIRKDGVGMGERGVVDSELQKDNGGWMVEGTKDFEKRLNKGEIMVENG